MLVGSFPRPASPQWRSGPRPGGRRGRLLDEVEKSLYCWRVNLGQPLHNGQVTLALEDGEEDYWMRLRIACAGGEPASPQWRNVPPPGGQRGRLLDEVEQSLCWWGGSLGQPLYNREVVLALQDGEGGDGPFSRQGCLIVPCLR